MDIKKKIGVLLNKGISYGEEFHSKIAIIKSIQESIAPKVQEYEKLLELNKQFMDILLPMKASL